MDFGDSIDSFLEKYGSATLSQSGLAAGNGILGVLFPPLGVAANAAQAAVLARLSHIQQERFEQACADIRERLERIEEVKLDSDFLQSDAHFDWLREAFDRIVRAEDEEKRAALRNVFLNGLLTNQSQGPMKNIVLRRLGDMSSYHVVTLRAISDLARPLGPEDRVVINNSTNANLAPARIEEVGTRLHYFSPVEFNAVLNDLVVMNVVADWSAGSLGAIGDLTRVVLTSLGSAVVRYMRDSSV